MAKKTDQERKHADRLNKELRETLESLQRVEQEILALSRDSDQEGGVPANHMADQGTDVYEMERLNTFRTELNDRVQMVREAQQRLADGTYGACQRCGRQISPERLEALPWAAYCIECQEVVDQEMDQTGLPPYPQLEPVENPRAGERKQT